MYYVFRKDDGTFAGSGIEPIEDIEHSSTEQPPPKYDNGIPAWNGQRWKIVNINKDIVSPLQIRLALIQSGVSLNQIDQAISTNEVAKIRWEYATEIHRNDDMLNDIAKDLGFTKQQIDTIFDTARFI